MSETLNKTKKTDILSVDPRTVVITEGFNVREDLGDIEGLAQSIKESGQQVPLKVVKVRGEEKYRLIDGHRRMAAINLLLKQGVSVPYVVVTLFQGSEEDEVFSMIITGTGQKQLNDIEQAEAIKRLIAFGYKVEEIAVKIGKSVPHVYNLTYIADFPKPIKDLIVVGSISASTALSISRQEKDRDKFIKVVDDAVADAQKSAKDGKTKKATNKNVVTLKTKTQAQKLAEAYAKLIEDGVNNEKVDFLEIVIHKSKDMSVEELVAVFSK